MPLRHSTFWYGQLETEFPSLGSLRTVPEPTVSELQAGATFTGPDPPDVLTMGTRLGHVGAISGANSFQMQHGSPNSTPFD